MAAMRHALAFLGTGQAQRAVRGHCETPAIFARHGRNRAGQFARFDRHRAGAGIFKGRIK